MLVWGEGGGFGYFFFGRVFAGILDMSQSKQSSMSTSMNESIGDNTVKDDVSYL